MLLTNPDVIEHHVTQLFEQYGTGSGHILNLGHGITPQVPPENVTAFLECVHRLSPNYH